MGRSVFLLVTSFMLAAILLLPVIAADPKGTLFEMKDEHYQTCSLLQASVNITIKAYTATGRVVVKKYSDLDKGVNATGWCGDFLSLNMANSVVWYFGTYLKYDPDRTMLKTTVAFRPRNVFGHLSPYPYERHFIKVRDIQLGRDSMSYLCPVEDREYYRPTIFAGQSKGDRENPNTEIFTVHVDVKYLHLQMSCIPHGPSCKFGKPKMCRRADF